MSNDKEMVKLIIKIPKNYLETIKHTVRSTAENGNTPLVFEIIANGTPLDSVKEEILQLDYDIDFVDYDYNDMPMTEEIHTICREEVLQILDNTNDAESEG